MTVEPAGETAVTSPGSVKVSSATVAIPDEYVAAVPEGIVMSASDGAAAPITAESRTTVVRFVVDEYLELATLALAVLPSVKVKAAPAPAGATAVWSPTSSKVVALTGTICRLKSVSVGAFACWTAIVGSVK